jgi:hypothetical protein
MNWSPSCLSLSSASFATIRFTVVHATARVISNDQDFFDHCLVGSSVCGLAMRQCSRR